MVFKEIYYKNNKSCLDYADLDIILMLLSTIVSAVSYIGLFYEQIYLDHYLNHPYFRQWFSIIVRGAVILKVMTHESGVTRIV